MATTDEPTPCCTDILGLPVPCQHDPLSPSPMTDPLAEVLWREMFARPGETATDRELNEGDEWYGAPSELARDLRAAGVHGPDGLREAIRSALNELGVPSDDYPAPVANAVGILRAALASPEPAPDPRCVCGAAWPCPDRNAPNYRPEAYRRHALASPEPDHADD